MSDILKLCTALPETRFPAGEVLLSERGEGGVLYVLLDGQLSVRKGSTEVARISEPGAVFGEMSVLLETPISASVIAETEVRVHVCSDPLPFILENPAFALHIARLLASRLQNATTYLADLKVQFEDRSDHFGMMDEILGAMVEHQPRARTTARKADDPRL